LTPEKHIVDAPAHLQNFPWYLAAVGVIASTIKMQTVLAWIAITIPIVSAVIGGLVLLGINNTHTQITEVKTTVNEVARKQDMIRSELVAELVKKTEVDHKQDLCLERIETILKTVHPIKLPPLSGGEFGNNK